MLMGAGGNLSQPIMQLVGNVEPLLLQQFGSLTLDDILEHHQAIESLPVLIVEDGGGEISPQRFAVLLQVPFLDFIAGMGVYENLRKELRVVALIVGVGKSRESAGGQLVLVIA